MPDRANALELRLFGLPVVRVNDQDERVNLKKLLGLVAYLSLEGATPRSRLAGLLWSDLDEESARRNLRRELVRVKTHASVLEGRFTSEGERLKLTEPWSSDAQTFEAALERDDLETALEVYRGPLLDGFEIAGADGFHGWLEVKREHYARLYRKVALDLAERLETKGNWRRALDLHLRLLNDDNLQERTHREVMRLHYLLGERAAALTQFERCREMLEAELGLDPMPETVRLAEQIRAAQSPGTRAANPARPELGVSSAVIAPLIGRQSAWQRLEEGWRAAQMMFIRGEPGVGKSRLIHEFVAAKGSFMLIEGQPTDALVPFATLRRAIRQTHSKQPDLKLPVWVERELSRLVPEMSDEPTVSPATLEESQYLFNAFTEWHHRALGPFSSLVIEDLQFFDVASLEMILHVLQGFAERTAHQRLIVSFRQGELAAPAEAAIERYTSSGLSVLIELEPLSEADTIELIQTAAGAQTSRSFAEHLFRVTGGNPFYALEIVRGLADTPPLDADQAIQNIPQTVHKAVNARLNRLPTGSLRLLEAASLTEEGFSLEALSGATALNEWESLEALERAVGAGVLEPFGDGHRFVHGLIRQSLQDGLRPERGRLLHRKLAGNLERQRGSPARIADHLERGGLVHEAAPWHVKAALAAAHVFANQVALGHSERALEIGLDAREVFAVRSCRLQIFERLADGEARARELDAMDAVATRLADNTLMAEVTLGRARLERNLGHYARALELTETLQPSVSGALAAQSDFQSGAALLRMGRLIEAEARLRQALEHLPQGMTAIRADVCDLLCTCALRQGQLEIAQQWADAALRAFMALENRDGRLKAQLNLGLIAGLGGDLVTATQTFARVLEEADQIGHLLYQRWALTNMTHFHLAGGEYAQARSTVEESLRRVREPHDPLLETNLLQQLSYTQCASGQLGSAFESLRTALGIAEHTNSGQQIAYRQVGLAELHLELGDLVGAQNALWSARDLVRTLGLDTIRLEIETLFARWEARLDQHGTALARLQGAINATPKGVGLEDWERAVFTLATLMVEQAPDEAVLLVEHLGASRLNHIRRLTVRLRAQLAGYGVFDRLEDGLKEAGVLLGGPMLPSQEFELRRITIATLDHVGDVLRAQTERAIAAERVWTLAASLDAHPELRQNFISAHRDVVPEGVF